MAEWTLRRRRGLALIIGIPVLLVASFWALTFTPLFHARHIRVEGAGSLTAQDVRTLAGVDDSTNVVHVDRDTLVRNLEASPWIADASVRVELPDTLVLDVTERRPVGVIDALGERGILASDATVLPPVAGTPEGLPIVRAALGAPDEDQRRAAASLLGVLDPVVSKRVAGVSVGQDGLVTLHLRSGTAVRAGEAGDEGAKAEALRAVLRWAATGGVELTSIDVSAPTAPSVTLRDGSTFTP